MKWFRLYDELVDDPKMILLPADIFRNVIFLWCVASQNDGYLPPVEAVAVKLRIPIAKTRKLLADLKARGLLDEAADGRLHPHNWNSRQFKSDGPSTPRVKRFRGRNKDDPGNGDETFHETKMKRPQSQRQNQKQNQRSEQHTSENEAARQAPSKSLVSPEAIRIADELGETAGFTNETWPLGWCGAASTIQKFLNDGCPGELVLMTVKAVMQRKTPESFAYFEKPIATAFANHKRPLPEVVITNPQPIEVRNGGQFARPRGAVQVALERLASLQGEAEADP